MKILNKYDIFKVSGAAVWHEETPQYTALIVTDGSNSKDGILTIFSDHVSLSSHTIHSGYTGSFTYNNKTTYVYPYLTLEGKCIGSIYITK